MQASYIDVDGINTRYLHAGGGNANALLLIHGGGLSADTWFRNIDALGAALAVYAPDSIGHGFTDPIDLGTDLPQPHTVGHLIAFMDAIGIDSFSVAGSSYGALIAGLVYFAVPERVDKLILVGSSSVFDTDEKYRAGLKRTYANAAATFSNPDLASCRRRMNTLVNDPASVPDELLLMQLTHYASPDCVEFYLTGNRNRVDAEGMIDHEDVLNDDFIYSDDAINFLWEIPNLDIFGAVAYQRLFNTNLANLLQSYIKAPIEVDGDDLIVHKEFKSGGIIQPKGKCSVSITHVKNGAALGHTAINIVAGDKAPHFAYSTNLNDEQIVAFQKAVIDMFYALNDDIFLATTKIISK